MNMKSESKNDHTIGGRGGVEDTRFEAKAKDTKKIRGQGQGHSFRGQNLLRPRTGMLEAKAKDQGHRRKCSPKKSLQKFFSGNLQFIGVPRIFNWGGLNHKSHEMTSSKFSKEEVFAGQRYRRMEDLKSLPVGT